MKNDEFDKGPCLMHLPRPDSDTQSALGNACDRKTGDIVSGVPA